MDWPLIWERIVEASRAAWVDVWPRLQAMTDAQWLWVALVVVLWMYFRANSAKQYLRGRESGLLRGFELATPEDDDYEDDDTPAPQPEASVYTHYATQVGDVLDRVMSHNKSLMDAIIDSSAAQREALVHVSKTLVEHTTSEHCELRAALAEGFDKTADTLQDVSQTVTNSLQAAITRLTTPEPTPAPGCKFVDPRDEDEEDDE